MGIGLSILLTLILICGIFLLLFAAVALIQNKKFFSSAPKDAYELIQDKPERFRGQHILGWIVAILAIIMVLGSVIFGIADGILKGYGFLPFFLRALIMLDGYKVWDMLFLDRYLLTKSGFFEHYYPEVGGAMGMQKPGFNNKSQFLKLLVIFPAISVVAALILSLIA